MMVGITTVHIATVERDLAVDVEVVNIKGVLVIQF